ncbi:hypothetical protein TSUD_309770 [Trifolium subterraneum]|uniref:Uncharacterized protein n=1 Tax=Trifolium subterraneum TaxID=3900 RepID=A0A2Z6LXI4_TRISU|nr:hypothetical protein TSUD_309770 [Trifolium subterraneum]
MKKGSTKKTNTEQNDANNGPANTKQNESMKVPATKTKHNESMKGPAMNTKKKENDFLKALPKKLIFGL